jgi:hypothetical protein
MKLPYRRLLNSITAFRELQEIKFPPRTSLDIYKLGKSLDKELETYQAMQRELYKRYEVPEKGQGYDLAALKEDEASKLIADIEELMDAEADVKEMEIPLEIFEQNGVPISTNLLVALDWLIKIGDEKEEASITEEKEEKAEAAVSD